MRRERAHASRCPPSASPRRSTTSGARRVSDADDRGERVEQRRLQMLAVQMARQRVAVAAAPTADADKSGRNGSSDASIARMRAATASAPAERRSKIERRAQNLHERRRTARRHRRPGSAPAAPARPRPPRGAPAARTTAGSCRRPARRRPRSRLPGRSRRGRRAARSIDSSDWRPT